MENNNNNFEIKFDGNKKTIHTENKKCVLLISVGQKYHESARLSATIDLINKSNFSSCTISVADTLQRHNIQDKSPEKAYITSLQLGDEWLARNEKHINKLKSAVTILRWDETLNDTDYPLFKKKIENEYVGNKFYRDAVDSTINTFLDRLKKRSLHIDLEMVFANCLKYLLEECPIIMPLWASQGYDYIIYPKVMTTAMAATYELFVKPSYQDKANWLALNFKKINAPSIHFKNHGDIYLHDTAKVS
ncbi:MAG: hypothetical protein A3F11_03865 [Gammaproteobacteria bacterium RIFCSPHIGHO2_12_FULL_37_14]|nr:MAG: hypothetical protein A3F11_03865 [Gammaproteobacteria bacterium RIFCSPHIGHO2_12_FULL_37_14]